MQQHLVVAVDMTQLQTVWSAGLLEWWQCPRPGPTLFIGTRPHQ